MSKKNNKQKKKQYVQRLIAEEKKIQEKKKEKELKKVEKQDNAWINDLENLDIHGDSDNDMQDEGKKKKKDGLMKKRIKKVKILKKQVVKTVAQSNAKSHSRVNLNRRKKVERKIRKAPQLYTKEYDFND